MAELTEELIDGAMQASFDAFKSGYKTALVNIAQQHDPEVFKEHRAEIEAHADATAQLILDVARADRAIHEDQRERVIARLKGERPTRGSYRLRSTP